MDRSGQKSQSTNYQRSKNTRNCSFLCRSCRSSSLYALVCPPSGLCAILLRGLRACWSCTICLAPLRSGRSRGRAMDVECIPSREYKLIVARRLTRHSRVSRRKCCTGLTLSAQGPAVDRRKDWKPHVVRIQPLQINAFSGLVARRRWQVLALIAGSTTRSPLRTQLTSHRLHIIRRSTLR
jgi:hypothetical protein